MFGIEKRPFCINLILLLSLISIIIFLPDTIRFSIAGEGLDLIYPLLFGVLSFVSFILFFVLLIGRGRILAIVIAMFGALYYLIIPKSRFTIFAFLLVSIAFYLWFNKEAKKYFR